MEITVKATTISTRGDGTGSVTFSTSLPLDWSFTEAEEIIHEIIRELFPQTYKYDTKNSQKALANYVNFMSMTADLGAERYSFSVEVFRFGEYMANYFEIPFERDVEVF